jgi:hypothetical protein
MTDPIYKLKTGYSIAADGDYVAVGNPTSFLSGSSILRNKGSVEIFKYSKTTDLYNPYFIFYKYINPDGFPGYLSADTSSADTTYITTVGLYDSDNELVAVAKLSQPTQKTFDSELLIRVRLDF